MTDLAALPGSSIIRLGRPRRVRPLRAARTQAQRRRNLFRPMPHPGEGCCCAGCDAVREENAATRTANGWPPKYPPAFYEGREIESWCDDWQRANEAAASFVPRIVGDLEF